MKTPSKWLVLLTVVAGSFIGSLNTSIVNVSIPALMRAFKAELHQVEWVVTAFMISFSVTMPLTSWLKERLSYRLLFVLSLAVFALGSLLCGVSDSLGMLIAARVIQAAGGGALAPLSMAIVTDVFPASERGRAFGIWGLGVVIGPSIGPTLGGYLTETLSWRWIFFINLPLALVAIVLGWKFLHRKKLEITHSIGLDLGGFVWVTAAIVSLLYTLATVAEEGLSTPSGALLLASAVFAYLFVRTERSARHPLWDLSLFENRYFVSCVLITLVRSMALFGGVFLLPLFLQGHMHLSETESGLIMLPGSLILALMMPISGAWADRGHVYSLTTAGLLVLAVSFIVFVGVDPGTPQWIVLAILLFRGVGLGLLITPLSSATMGAVRPGQVAMASSISNVAQQVGGSLGIALIVLFKSLFIRLAVNRGYVPDRAEFISLQACFVIAGLFVLVSLVPARAIRGLKKNSA